MEKKLHRFNRAFLILTVGFFSQQGPMPKYL